MIGPVLAVYVTGCAAMVFVIWFVDGLTTSDRWQRWADLAFIVFVWPVSVAVFVVREARSRKRARSRQVIEMAKREERQRRALAGDDAEDDS